VLVGHSGAGPLLPCIAEAINRPVVGLVFVDAGIPRPGASRLDLLAEETSTDIADKLRAFLERGGSYPVWRDAELNNLIPDAKTRREVLQEVKAWPLGFWEERLHVPEGWLAIPCAYLRLSHGYAVPAAEAQRRGWPYRELDGGHFLTVVYPEVVASELVELLTAMGIGK
jgi:pimeloyl-ACP methyl ester carboxylesterase